MINADSQTPVVAAGPDVGARRWGVAKRRPARSDPQSALAHREVIGSVPPSTVASGEQ